jgi:hypothetical protein
MTHFPPHCPQSGLGHTRPLSDLCRANIDMEAAPCLRCERGEVLARARDGLRRADAVAKGMRQ